MILGSGAHYGVGTDEINLKTKLREFAKYNYGVVPGGVVGNSEVRE